MFGPSWGGRNSSRWEGWRPRRRGWPPPALLALAAGPLAYRAAVRTSGDLSSFDPDVKWFALRAARGEDVPLDEYSKGTTCLLELAERQPAPSPPGAGPAAGALGRGPGASPDAGSSSDALISSRWYPGGSNCKPHLHCPLWAPIAVALVDRVASTSLLAWLAALDGRPPRGNGTFEPVKRVRPTLWEIWESLATAYRWGDVDRLFAYWLHPELRAVGLSAPQSRSLTGWILLSWWHVGRAGRRFHLPPHLCLTCCGRGAHRKKVLFARDPFARLVSCFRMAWLGNPAKVHSRWEDFPVFVRYVSEVFNDTDAYSTLPTSFSHGQLDRTGDSREFTFDDLMHTRAITDWVSDPRLLQPQGVADFHVIRVEHLQDGLSGLAKVLCREHGYCKKLPPFPRVNTFKAAVPGEVWAECWADRSTVRQAVHRYRRDFELLAYPTEPAAPAPGQPVRADAR